MLLRWRVQLRSKYASPAGLFCSSKRTVLHCNSTFSPSTRSCPLSSFVTSNPLVSSYSYTLLRSHPIFLMVLRFLHFNHTSNPLFSTFFLLDGFHLFNEKKPRVSYYITFTIGVNKLLQPLVIRFEKQVITSLNQSET